MKKLFVTLLVLGLLVSVAYAVQPIGHSVLVNIPAQVTVAEIFKLTVDPAAINFGVVDIGNSSTVELKTTGETNCGKHISLQIKGIDFTQPLGQVLNVIEIEKVKMVNTLAIGQGQTTDLTMTEQYQEFAKSTGNPHGYIVLGVKSQYTITIPTVDAGLYTSIFTITMTE